MASGRAPLVSRDSTSALHYLLQPTASTMETFLGRNGWAKGYASMRGDPRGGNEVWEVLDREVVPREPNCGVVKRGEGPDAESTTRRLECFGLLALQVDQRLKVVVFRCAGAGQST